MRSVNCTLRSVRAINDTHGWNELNMLLTDRYNAGVLNNPLRCHLHLTSFLRSPHTSHHTLGCVTIAIREERKNSFAVNTFDECYYVV